LLWFRDRETVGKIMKLNIRLKWNNNPKCFTYTLWTKRRLDVLTPWILNKFWNITSLLVRQLLFDITWLACLLFSEPLPVTGEQYIESKPYLVCVG
jgi:hypothetical protein